MTMSLRPELPTSIARYDESFDRLRRVAEASYGLLPDESYDAAAAALKAWAKRDGHGGPETELYGRVLDECAQKVLERRQREREFFANPLTAELYVAHHSRLARILESRHHLDFDHADSAGLRAIQKFVRTAQLKSEAGDPSMLQKPERYWPYLYSTCLTQAASDERAKIDGRRAPDNNGQAEAQPGAEAKSHKPGKRYQLEPLHPNLADDAPTLDELIDQQKAIQQAAPLLARVPDFFHHLESKTGQLAARFRQLRRLAQMMGAESPIDELCFLQRYLFENKSGDGESARRELTRQLGWFADKADNAKSLALRRLRVQLQKAWTTAQQEVFLLPCSA